MKMKRYAQIAAGALLVVCLSLQAQASGSGIMDNDLLQELKRMIEQQQAQLDKQAAEIAALKEQLAGNTEALDAKADKEEVKDIDKMVTSSFSNVNVSLYGQVNRALLYANNGDTSKWYSVDNINSQTRLGLNASIAAPHGWNIGSRIEYGIVSNGSSDVNNLNTRDATTDSFKLRWAEVSFKNDMYGKISLGKGDSASNNTTEVDLSGTAVAAYIEVVDMAGATLWYESDTDTLSSLRIKDVFNNFDGLSRTDRIRYDTPSYGGFSVAASASSGDAFDAALMFNREFNGTKLAAAVFAANPGDIVSAAEAMYGGSVSVLLPMGFNATFSAATRNLEASDRDDPTNWMGKLGYRTKFYDAASTAFSIDYGETTDLNMDGDKAKTWALAAVHNVIDWGTEFYMVWRQYKLETDLADFDDINTFMAGARVKF